MSDAYETVWDGAAWRNTRPVPPPPTKPAKRRKPQVRVSDARWRVSLALQSGPHTACELQAMTGLCASAIVLALKHLRRDQRVTWSPEPPAFGRPRVRYTWIDR